MPGTTSEAAPAPAASAPPGLTGAEARRLLAQWGPNTVVDKTPPASRRYLAKFWSPIAWLLEAAIVLELLAGKDLEAAVIAGLLVFNATLGFVQEGRAGAALAALKRRLAPSALVRRDGQWLRLPAAEVVTGDLIRLALGALIPADARILSGAVLVDQSMLTGESIPVDAGAGSQLYAGSLVRRGQALAEVTAIGLHTSFGRAAELVRTAHSTSTEQKAIFAATRNLVVVNGTVAVALVVCAYAIGMPPGDLIRLALTALLATIPAALPATFTLSAAFGAQTLARRGVLLTRLSAVHEAAAMDLLCADKTGTLTRNELAVVEVTAMPDFSRDRVLILAALASSEADQDPIDAAIRAAAESARTQGGDERLVRFVPFDPTTRTSEAIALDRDGNELRIVKGALEAVSELATVPAEAFRLADDLAGQGHRVIAVAAGKPQALQLAGLIAISDPPREDSAEHIAALRGMGVRTIMVTGDSPATATAIARKVGIVGEVASSGEIVGRMGADKTNIFARVLPEEKYRLVQALQGAGHVVGMCGDGTNDAPALRQAQIGIALSTATDAAKAAAGVVLTEPGLAGVVFAVREGRIAFQRLLAYTFNMLVKKIEIVLFLAIGLVLVGQPVLTPMLVLLMLLTNDFLAMSLTTDRAGAAPSPCRWRMRSITGAAIVLAACKLAFSLAVLAIGKFRLGLNPGELQTLALVTLVFGAQALLYVVREQGRMWSSRPGTWILAASAADIAIVCALALSGTLMEPLPWRVLVYVLLAAAGFAVVLDQVKLGVRVAFRF